MSCPAGRPSISALAVKSVSGSASTKTALRTFLKLSVVATSTNMRDGRSARAHIIPESIETSPDWTPWVMRGRSAARLRAGLAIPTAATAADEAPAVRKRRRVRARSVAMESGFRITRRKLPASSDRGPTFVRQLRERRSRFRAVDLATAKRDRRSRAFRSSRMGGEVKTDHACNDEDETCHSEYIRWLAESHHADDHRACGPDSRPQGIGGSKRHGLQGNREQAEAERNCRDHGHARPEPGEAIRVFEPESPGDLQQSSEQESEPSGERIGGLHHRLGRPLLTFRRGAGLELVITAHSQNGSNHRSLWVAA